MKPQRCTERGCPWRGDPERCPWHSAQAQHDDNHAWDSAHGHARPQWSRKEGR